MPGRPHILVVDDEPLIVEPLCHLLERQGLRKPAGIGEILAALGRVLG